MDERSQLLEQETVKTLNPKEMRDFYRVLGGFTFMGASNGEDVLGDGDDLGPDAVAGEDGDAVAPGPRWRGGGAAEARASPRTTGSLRIEV